MIQIYRLFKTFGPNTAIRDLNLRVREGEFVFVTGPSGAGKTTLLRLVFGVERPSSGHIVINGVNLSRVSRSKLDLLRRKIGFVFQDFKLLPKKSVFENVALALEVTGERTSFIRKKTHQTLKLVGLTGKEKAFPLQLSGGEQQRVAIARAIVKDPLILLADEPTGNLDSRSGQAILDLMLEFQREFKTTLLMVTHNPDIARRADTRFRLADGRITGPGA